MTKPTDMTHDPGAPFSQEAEEAVLGSVLLDPSQLVTLAAFLKADDFFLLRHQYIWKAFERLSLRHDPIDYITVGEELENMEVLDNIGGRAYLVQLVSNTGTAIYAEVYGRLVERTAIRRRLMVISDEIKKLAQDESLNIEHVISEAENKLFGVTETQVKREFVPIWDALSDYYDQMEYMLQHQQEASGLPTGFRDLDQLLGGFQKSDLLIFAGRPGMGKCVASNSVIYTSNGVTDISHLKPENVAGEIDDEGGIYYPLEIEVLTPEGIQKTSYFYDAGEKPTLKITTCGGYSLSGTPNHALLILNQQGEKEWRRLGDLRTGDYVAVLEEGVIHYAPTNAVGTGYIPSATKTEPSVLTATDLLPAGYDWDEVVSIEDDGIQHCYDLVVPGSHSYIANGIVSHNTSWLLTTAMNTARLGARVAIFTMEMGVEQMVQRMMAMETGINVQKLRLARLTPQEAARFTEAVGRISELHIFIDDTPALSPLEIRTKCRRLKHEYGLDLVIVDYMQLMNAGGTYENNRVQEISFISRALKELARELNVPLISAAQLSRAVEQRQDKRPVLSDLRESGCITGESLVYLPDCGYSVPIKDLIGKTGFRVMSINTETWKAEPAIVTNSFCTGVKPVYKMTTALGRSIRATGNHKFMTIEGWKRLDELTMNDHIAVPRSLPDQPTQTMSNAELALLGHLIGDGCTLPTHAIQYTTVEPDLAQLVADLATEVFGDTVAPRVTKEKGRNWYQVFIAPTARLTHGVRNPVGVWLEKMGAWGLRSYEKHIPNKVFEQPNEAIALFLRHLWSTDGCLKMTRKGSIQYPAVYYASSSYELAYGVQSLLMRFGINAPLRIIPQKNGRNQHHVTVTGKNDLEIFVSTIGAVGKYKQNDLSIIRQHVESSGDSSKRDYIPYQVWVKHIVPEMGGYDSSLATFCEKIRGRRYDSTIITTKNLGRNHLENAAKLLNSEKLSYLAGSDVYWDAIVSIEPDGEEQVFDLTVEPNHDFICNNVILSNSIEQDSDIVMFLYRDEIYNEATEFPNQADVIVAKHRNGPTGTISLYFEKSLTKFMDASVHRVDLSDLE